MADPTRSTNLAAGLAVVFVIAVVPSVSWAESGQDARVDFTASRAAESVASAAASAAQLPLSQGPVANVPLPLPRPEPDAADQSVEAETPAKGTIHSASVPLPPPRPVLMAMLAPAEAVAMAVGPAPVAVGVESIRSLIARHAAANGVPARLADAVVRHESRYNPKARNGGNIGLMQISLPTARSLGYDGSASGLADAETNLTYGVRYLAQAWRLAGGDTCRAILKYQAGHRAVTMTSAARSYCADVAQAARSTGQAPAGSAAHEFGATEGDAN